jgi:hypothetical protein
MKMPKSLIKVIDEDTWVKFCNKLPDLEAQKVLYDVIEYVTHRLKSRVQEIRRLAAHTPEFKWLDGICFLSQGREFLTVNVTRKGLRIYFHSAARIYLDAKEKYEVEKMNLWKTSYHKKTGKYRGFTVWISKEANLPGIKKLLDMIPQS